MKHYYTIIIITYIRFVRVGESGVIVQYSNDEPPRNSRRSEVGGICVSGMGLM